DSRRPSPAGVVVIQLLLAPGQAGITRWRNEVIAAGRVAAARGRRPWTAPSVTEQLPRRARPHCCFRRGGATPRLARDGRHRPPFVVVRASRRRLHGRCSARNPQLAAAPKSPSGSTSGQEVTTRLPGRV